LQEKEKEGKTVDMSSLLSATLTKQVLTN
jgi:hypothetical protein